MLGVATQGVAQAPSPEGLVWMAIRDINAVYGEDVEPMNRPSSNDEAAGGHDPRGRPDWLVDYEPSGVNSVCDTGGCLRRLYVSVDDQDYMQVMDAQC